MLVFLYTSNNQLENKHEAAFQHPRNEGYKSYNVQSPKSSAQQIVKAV